MQKWNREFSERRAEESGDLWRRLGVREMEAHCIAKIAIVVEQHIRRIRLLAAFRGVRSFCLLPKPIDKPHRSAGATRAAPLEEERRRPMESHHELEGMKPKGLFIRSRRIT